MSAETVLFLGYPVDLLTLWVEAAGVVASAAIAVAGAVIAYRQTYGSAPLQIIVSHGLRGGGGVKHHTATLEVEIWNLRRYPIQVRGIIVTFEGMKFEYLIGDNISREWYPRGPTLSLMKQAGEGVQIAPQGSHLFQPLGHFYTPSLDSLSSKVRVTTTIFDPVSSRSRKLHSRHLYKLN